MVLHLTFSASIIFVQSAPIQKTQHFEEVTQSLQQEEESKVQLEQQQPPKLKPQKQLKPKRQPGHEEGWIRDHNGNQVKPSEVLKPLIHLTDAETAVIKLIIL